MGIEPTSWVLFSFFTAPAICVTAKTPERSTFLGAAFYVPAASSRMRRRGDTR